MCVCVCACVCCFLFVFCIFVFCFLFFFVLGGECYRCVLVTLVSPLSHFYCCCFSFSLSSFLSQVIASQRKFAISQQEGSTSSLTVKAIEEQLEHAQRRMQETIAISNESASKLHTANNETHRAKQELEEERRKLEKMRDQMSRNFIEQEEVSTSLRNKYDETLQRMEQETKDERVISSKLREEIAVLTTEAMAAASNVPDVSVLRQYKEELTKLRDERASDSSKLREVQTKLETTQKQVNTLEDVNTDLHLQVRDMTETMEIKDSIFKEHAATAKKLTRDRDSLSAEIVALKTALAMERNGAEPLTQNASRKDVERGGERDVASGVTGSMTESVTPSPTPSLALVPPSVPQVSSALGPRPPPSAPPPPQPVSVVLPSGPPPSPTRVMPSFVSTVLSGPPPSAPLPSGPPPSAPLPSGPPPSVPLPSGPPRSVPVAGPPPSMHRLGAHPASPPPSAPPVSPPTGGSNNSNNNVIFARPPPSLADNEHF